jgi:hypothetical protein
MSFSFFSPSFGQNILTFCWKFLEKSWKIFWILLLSWFDFLPYQIRVMHKSNLCMNSLICLVSWLFVNFHRFVLFHNKLIPVLARLLLVISLEIKQRTYKAQTHKNWQFLEKFWLVRFIEFSRCSIVLKCNWSATWINNRLHTDTFLLPLVAHFDLTYFAREETTTFCDVVSKVMANYNTHTDISFTDPYWVLLARVLKILWHGSWKTRIVETDETAVVRERPINTFKIFVMDLEETEARNGCTGEGQQQFDRPTNREDVM